MSRSKKRTPSAGRPLETVRIDKLVHGGQAIGEMADGRKIFVWNALPDELVEVRISKSKRHFAEGIAETIIEASPDRIEPREENYLSTSPWQILPLDRENQYKASIVHEAFAREHVELSDNLVCETSGPDWQYRNKMEYSFWGDDDGLHLALYKRGTHGKYILDGSALAQPAVDAGARGVLAQLSALPDLRAADLKTIVVRSSQAGQTVGALFVKRDDFPALPLPDSLSGLRIYYSNPKSPASLTTTLLHEIGDCSLSDKVLGYELHYDVTGFWQVNQPIFGATMAQIDAWTKDDHDIIDMYSGVGSIGIPLQRTKALIELDPFNVVMAKQNTSDIEVIEASSETALEYITEGATIIVDPPRSGLHKDVVERILAAKPQKIIYLSCNPSTQARDIALLSAVYKIDDFHVYNFFPHTPHIESLALLTLQA